MEIRGKVTPNMIHIGDNTRYPTTNKPLSIWTINGTIVFNGPIKFFQGTYIYIAENAILDFGTNGTFIGSDSKIICRDRITIGNSVEITWECQIYDTSFHYIKHEGGNVEPLTKPIVIDSNVWIGNRTTISKGCILPSHTIVASGSLCNKDYSVFGHNFLLAGTPAKCKTFDVDRIYAYEEEKLYDKHSYYLGNDENIVPNDIARCFIEPILTPEEYQPFYNDKNSLGVVISKDMMPRTIFRSINGLFYDGDYEPTSPTLLMSLLDKYEKVIVKPAKDMGGKGVTLFYRKGDNLIDDKGNVLNYDFLHKTYNTNYLIQECLVQNAFMAQFNPTSVNTIRIAVYRDFENGALSILGAFLRIGGKGSYVDNISSGGSSVVIDTNTGRLGTFACDISRIKHPIYNDIDFENNEFIIPKWDEITEFVFNVAKKMPHMSLFANDVAIDKDGNPKLIEVNTTNFSYTFYQVSGSTFFGKHTDKLISHCKDSMKKYKPAIYLKRFD